MLGSIRQHMNAYARYNARRVVCAHGGTVGRTLS